MFGKKVMPSDLRDQWEGLKNWKCEMKTGGEEQPDVEVGLQQWRGEGIKRESRWMGDG